MTSDAAALITDLSASLLTHDVNRSSKVISLHQLSLCERNKRLTSCQSVKVFSRPTVRTDASHSISRPTVRTDSVMLHISLILQKVCADILFTVGLGSIVAAESGQIVKPGENNYLLKLKVVYQ